MKASGRTVLLVLLIAAIAGCSTSRKQVLASGSQVEVRSYQTRTYDTDNKIRVLRAVMATLQDLGFVIDRADDMIGIVSATKLQGYALSMSISVRPNGQQMIVRANAQYNLTAVEDPGPYQDFFTSLDKGLFLDGNLYADDIATQSPTASSSAATGEDNASDVFAYYGEAEQEIIAGTQNPDLWAKAFVQVEGDEQKRKARYIELRAEELHAAYAPAFPASNQSILPVVAIQSAVKQTPTVGENAATSMNSAPPTNFNLTGTYRSDRIKGSPYFIFSSRSRLTIRLAQKGSMVTGEFTSGLSGSISGTVVGNTIKFSWMAGNCADGEGEWLASSDGLILEGPWICHSYRNKNIWTFHKITG
jgi:hypothetical protein